MYNSIIVRLEFDHRLVGFGDVAAAIGKAGGDIAWVEAGRGECLAEVEVHAGTFPEGHLDASSRRP